MVVFFKSLEDWPCRSSSREGEAFSKLEHYIQHTATNDYDNVHLSSTLLLLLLSSTLLGCPRSRYSITAITW